MARPARSLDVLLAEVNDVAPDRNKASDGWLGDPAHQSRASRHNPNDFGVVCARDITDDPDAGMPVHVLARAMTAPDRPFDPPEDLEYIISDREVARRRDGWAWEPYTGENPHTQHAHFAVGRGPDSEPRPPYDGTATWHVAALLGAPAPTPDLEDPDMRIVSAAPEGPAFYLITGGNMARLADGTVAAAYKASGVPHVVVGQDQIDMHRRDLFHSVDKGVLIRPAG